MKNKVYTAIGLMSGTSLDGEIDVALIRTDGHDFVEPIDFRPYPYPSSARERVRACFGKRQPDALSKQTEQLITDLHQQAVLASGFKADIIGFHGQTITHDPAQAFTWQLGDGPRLAAGTGMDVIYNFRTDDMRFGGQGAPLIPLYHKAITSNRIRPLAVLNLGGVGNVTYIGPDDTLIAFDTGPANALIDDAVFRLTGKAFDKDGVMALKGKASDKSLEAFLSHPYFDLTPPKSLDRNDFVSTLPLLPKNPDDLIATLTAFTIFSVVKACDHFPVPPKEWLVCGGGRKNAAIMKGLEVLLDVPVRAIEDAGWNGDAIEAQGFAYLAVRSLLGLPLTFPGTTGVTKPLTGGLLAKA